MKKTLLLLILTASVVYGEPDDLVRVRETYLKKIDETNDTYTKWLRKRVIETTGESKDAYFKELEKLGGKPSVTLDEKPEDGERQILDGKTITIDSQVGFTKLGKLKVGETIKIQYFSGEWSAHSDFEKENPDNPVKNFHGVTLVCKDYDSTILVSKPVSNTLNNVFEHTVAEGETGEYFLSMNTPSDKRKSSNGSVKYKINTK